MKANDIRNLSVEELREKVAGLQEELFNLRFQAKLGTLANPLRLRAVRRDIARVMTIRKQKNAAV